MSWCLAWKRRVRTVGVGQEHRGLAPARGEDLEAGDAHGPAPDPAETREVPACFHTFNTTSYVESVAKDGKKVRSLSARG